MTLIKRLPSEEGIFTDFLSCTKLFFNQFVILLIPFYQNIRLFWEEEPITPFIITEKYLIRLCALLVFTISSAQEFRVEGEVRHDLNEEVDNIHVFNITTSKGTVTDRNGKFTIPVSIGDTLFISAIQFEKKTLVISLGHFVSKKISVDLQSITNELDEIFIKNHNLTGRLDTDAKNIKTEPVITAVSLGILEKEIRVLTQSQRKLKTAQSGFLDPLINGISGRTKMLKRRVEIDKDNQIIESLLEKFSTNFLAEELKLDEADIYDFLYFCEADPAYKHIVRQDRINILHFLAAKATSYSELKSEEEK